MALRDVTLDDKYDLTQRHVFVTGFQALVRLCLMQKELDRRNGLNTGGFVTGYRGSPLGTLDSQFLRAQRFLEKSDIRFQGGLNEDLAATAIWGTQQVELRGEGKYDGVFGMWYGKGPGVDRTGDVFRHANFAGSSKHGGVLALMGDDHTAESSTTAHQSEFHFVDVMIPILNPAGVQEILDYGLYGWAMSRFCGSWTALKCMHETIESTAIIDGSLERVNIVIVVWGKRSRIEVQVREELYGTANQPVCIGKKDERGNWLFPVKGALDPNDIAICIGERLLARGQNEQLASKIARLKERQRAL